MGITMGVSAICSQSTNWGRNYFFVRLGLLQKQWGSNSHGSIFFFASVSFLFYDLFILGWRVAVWRCWGLITTAFQMSCHLFIRWRWCCAGQTWGHRQGGVLDIKGTSVLLVEAMGVRLETSSSLSTTHYHSWTWAGLLVQAFGMCSRFPVNQNAWQAAGAAVVGQVTVLGVGGPSTSGLLKLASPKEEQADDDEQGHAQQRNHHVDSVCTLRAPLAVAAHCVDAASFPKLHLGSTKEILYISTPWVHVEPFAQFKVRLKLKLTWRLRVRVGESDLSHGNFSL